MASPALRRFTALALAIALGASCGSDSDSPPDDGDNGDGGDGGDGGNTDFTISVQNNNFSPTSLTVPLGATVTWNWATGAAGHNVVGDDGSHPPSSGGLVNAPRSYAFTFTTAGTFRYYCQAHGSPGGSGMAGTIIAQ
jgi:plastocyanin